MALAIGLGWLRQGGALHWVAASRTTDASTSQLTQLGLNVEELHQKRRFIVEDWYTYSLGQKPVGGYESLKVSELSINLAKGWMRAPPAPDRIIIVDNFSILDRFNDEKSWVEFTLGRAIPGGQARKITIIRGLMEGVHSPWAYKQMEAGHDGIIDFRLDESGEETRNLVRIRNLRNAAFDSRWHKLNLSNNFEFTVSKS